MKTITEIKCVYDNINTNDIGNYDNFKYKKIMQAIKFDDIINDFTTKINSVLCKIKQPKINVKIKIDNEYKIKSEIVIHYFDVNKSSLTIKINQYDDYYYIDSEYRDSHIVQYNIEKQILFDKYLHNKYVNECYIHQQISDVLN